MVVPHINKAASLMCSKKIIVASDHAGYALKKAVIPVLEKLGFNIIDAGTKDQESVDYPDYGAMVSKAIQNGDAKMGVVVCGTGIGISIASNRYKGIRAALCYNEETARLAREHNNANVLALGGRTMDFEEALRIARVFFSTPYEPAERHDRRIEKMDTL